MPAKSDNDLFGEGWEARYPRGYAHFRRGFENILECARSHCLHLLVPRFREFFEFCEGRTFTPEARHLVDLLRRMVADLNIEV